MGKPIAFFGSPVLMETTLWGSLAHAELPIADQNQTGAADQAAIETDVDLLPHLTGALEYDYFRRTGEPKARCLGVTAALRL